MHECRFADEICRALDYHSIKCLVPPKTLQPAHHGAVAHPQDAALRHLRTQGRHSLDPGYAAYFLGVLEMFAVRQNDSQACHCALSATLALTACPPSCLHRRPRLRDPANRRRERRRRGLRAGHQPRNRGRRYLGQGAVGRSPVHLCPRYIARLEWWTALAAASRGSSSRVQACPTAH